MPSIAQIPDLSRVLRLDSGGALIPVQQADAARFRERGAHFISNAEDLSAIVEASSVLGAGWFLLTVQVNAGNQWLDRAPKGRNEQTVWWRHHDQYDQAAND